MESGVPNGFEQLDLGPGFMKTFGPVYLRRDTCTLGFRVAAHHLNPVDVCNGGALATFADMQIAAVAKGLGTAGGHLPTISLSVDYLGTAPCDAWVEAAVTLVKTTRNLIFTQALITTGGNAIVRSTGIYRNYQSSPSHAKAQAPGNVV
jgi:acyl-coenzyme A thioesterase PaaI-like protein